MVALIRKYKIQIAAALLTAVIIYVFPIIKGGGSPSDVSSFRSAFGQLALISYVLYLGSSFIFLKLVRRFQLHRFSVYLAHAVAFAIGYYLLVAAYLSIAAGGIPSII